jgi:hypothetical protein
MDRPTSPPWAAVAVAAVAVQVALVLAGQRADGDRPSPSAAT